MHPDDQYKLVKETSQSEFEKRINELLSLGWTPFGNLIVTSDGRNLVYIREMAIASIPFGVVTYGEQFDD